MNAPPDRFSYPRAPTAGYDSAFRRHLAEQIATVIAKARMVHDVGMMMMRTADALADVLNAMLALVPRRNFPSKLGKTTEAYAKRLGKLVAQARAQGVGAEFLGRRREGNA
jgi:hypothetical protein